MTVSLRQFCDDRQGAVAVELALCLPAMLLLFFGCYEASTIIRADIKLGEAAQTIANMVATQDTVTDACQAGRLVMAPFAGDTLAAAIVSVAPGSAALSATCGATGAVAPPAVAPGIASDPGGFVVVTATYSYRSPIAYVLSPVFDLSHTAYARPRAVHAPNA